MSCRFPIKSHLTKENKKRTATIKLTIYPTTNAMSSFPPSTAKQAVQLMNVTGVCAHPIHFHSFSVVGGGEGNWIFNSPRSLFVKTFEKCSGCQGRLGASVKTTDNSSEPSDNSFSSSGIVQCVACGIYAHRTCAFSTKSGGSLLSPCQTNLPLVKGAMGDLPTDENETILNNEVTECDDDNDKSPDLAQEEKLSRDCLEERIVPAEVEKKKDPTALTLFQTSVEIVKKTSETSKRIPKASTVGLVAGGAVGLAIAGPAGCIVGSQIGRTVLVVGAALEGGMGIGVLVMSLAAAANFSLTSKKDQRELKLMEQGSKTLVLVRPEIDCDPRWVVYADEARESWERMSKGSSSSGSSIGSFFLSSSDNRTSPDFRYGKDADIIKADSTELAIREKVFLLVNRILNDKMSLPGYVYRHLILKHKRMQMFENVSEQSQNEGKNVGNMSRIRRTNAHNIIKHVTATLLEVRPGLASSSVMTELSADAVELLVFGELYCDIYDEIVLQTHEQDLNLSNKVRELRDQYKNENEEAGVAISQPAIGALRSLPQAHTPADKLYHCVVFLESISEHFSTIYQGKCIDADTLLVMVCQHVVTSNVSHLHAEVVFLEEFSRDEQLLSGKEGYALITLQAALHYLDSLEEFAHIVGPIH